MAERFDIPFTPGGLNTDVVANKIGTNEFTDVQNLRMNKAGEWVNDPGYLAVKSGMSGILSGKEVTDDLSGHRFVIYHSGSSLYRINYDDGDGNGYENETASALTLPDGVTLTSSDTLKYRWYQGVLWILGASHPMRYEYIQRTLMQNAERTIDTDDFQLTADSWTGNNATAVRSAGGLPGAPYAFDLLITQTALNGSARKTFSITEGDTYRFECWIKGSGDKVVSAGTSAGASDYGTDTLSSSKSGWFVAQITFVATNSTLYINVNPDSGGSSATGNIGYVRLHKIEVINHAQWSLAIAHVDFDPFVDAGDAEAFYQNNILNSIVNDNLSSLSLQYNAVFDGSQYTLPKRLEVSSYNYSINANVQALSAYILVDADIFESHRRMTGFALVGDAGLSAGEYINNRKIISDIIDFSNPLPDITFQHASLAWNSTPVLSQILLLGKEVDTANSKDYSTNGYLMPGSILHCENINGATDLLVDEVYFSGSDFDVKMQGIGVIGDLTPLLDGSSIQDLPPTTITIERKMLYSNGDDQYGFYVVIDVINSPDYYDLTGFPPGVSDISYDYKDKVIIGGRAVVLSAEDGEEDVIRYSLPYQYDVFPSTFYGQTEIGDSDSNIAIEAMDDRVIICKRKSVSKLQVTESGVSQDIGIAQRGLYADNGLIVIDGMAYFMDESDVYVFDGVSVRSLLANSRVRNYYKDNVTTSSFIMFNKIDNELWLRLDDTFLVYQFDFDLWRIVDYNTTPTYWWLDADNQLIFGRSSLFMNVNHGLLTTSSAPQCRFTTRLIDTDNPEQLKKLTNFVLYCKSADNVKIKMTDIDSGEYKVITITPSTTEVTAIEDWEQNFFFKNLELEFYTYTISPKTTELVLRSLRAGGLKWR